MSRSGDGTTKKMKPLCHPTRKHFRDNMCKDCWRDSQQDPAEMSPMEVRKYNELVELHKATEYVENLGKQARAILLERVPQYADIHMKGALMAALKGDTRPAEWALTHLKPDGKNPVVEELPKGGGAAGGDTGIKVLIGVNLGGLPGEAKADVVIPAESVKVLEP